MKRLGLSNDKFPIVARGVAEDNSGIVVELVPGVVYEMRLSYPIGEDKYGLPIHTETFKGKDAKTRAIEELQIQTGYKRWNEGERDARGNYPIEPDLM